MGKLIITCIVAAVVMVPGFAFAGPTLSQLPSVMFAGVQAHRVPELPAPATRPSFLTAPTAEPVQSWIAELKPVVMVSAGRGRRTSDDHQRRRFAGPLASAQPNVFETTVKDRLVVGVSGEL